MRIEHGYRPVNRWLARPLDERWSRWLSGCVVGAAVVGVSMGAFVGPRQSVMRIRYEIAQLTDEVDRLEREQRRLRLERETLTSPEALSRQIAELGLEITPRERVAHLTADGRILFAPAPAATGRNAPATGSGAPAERSASQTRAPGSATPARAATYPETRVGGDRTPRGDISERPALPARARGVRGGEGAGAWVGGEGGGVGGGGDRTPRGK